MSSIKAKKLLHIADVEGLSLTDIAILLATKQPRLIVDLVGDLSIARRTVERILSVKPHLIERRYINAEPDGTTGAPPVVHVVRTKRASEILRAIGIYETDH